MVTRLGPTSTATRMGVVCVIVAVVVGAVPAAASGLPDGVVGILVGGCIAAGCLFFLRYRTSVRLTSDAVFVREWLVYRQYLRSDLESVPTTADFRVLGIRGVVPVLVTREGRGVRLWGLAEPTPEKLQRSLGEVAAWLQGMMAG